MADFFKNFSNNEIAVYKILQKAYEEKDCCTCENCIILNEYEHGREVTFSRCEIKGNKMVKGCDLYKRKEIL